MHKEQRKGAKGDKQKEMKTERDTYTEREKYKIIEERNGMEWNEM